MGLFWHRSRLVGGVVGFVALAPFGFLYVGCHSSTTNGVPDPAPYQVPPDEGDADTSRALDGGPRVLDCDAGQTTCNGECVDLSTDLVNCGVCGHGCLGGGCATSQCLPVTLVSGQSGPGGIALDDVNVYFTNITGGTVVSVPKLGGPTITLATSQDTPSALAVDATDVYWTSRIPATGAVFRCALAGCALNGPSALASGLESPDWLALDATNVYYTTNGSGDAGAADGTVGAVGKDGQNRRDLIAAQNVPYGLAIDDAHVFFSTHGATGAIVRCPLVGKCTNPLTLTPPQNLPARIVLDGATAFWTNNGGSLGRVDKTGDNYKSFATGGAPTRLAIDANYIYWTDGPAMTVSRATKDGQGVKVIATGQVGALSIAVDDNAVYWTNSSGQVMRLAK